MDDKILNMLLKRALGYTFKEVQEEFAVKEDGDLALTKRKVMDKYYPPDSNALKTYLELSGEKSIEEYSDEELVAEKKRLLEELRSADAAIDKDGNNTKNDK